MLAGFNCLAPIFIKIRFINKGKELKKLLFAALLCAPIISHAACQCDQDEPEDDGSYREYSYIGVKGGVAQFKTPTIIGTSNSYGATWGHRYSKLFGTEVDYAYLGKYQDALSIGHSTAVSVSGLHFYNISDSFALIGKLGVAYTNTSNKPTLGRSDTNLTYGVGVDWQVSRELGLRIEIDKYALKMPAATAATNAFLGFNFNY